MNAQLFNYLLRITSCSIICLIYLFYNHKRSKEYQKTVDNLENQLENLEKERLELMQENKKLSHIHNFPQPEPVSNGISNLKTALNKATIDLNTAIQTAQIMARIHEWGLK